MTTRLLVLAVTVIGVTDTAAAQVPEPKLITEGQGGFTFDLNEGDPRFHQGENFGSYISPLWDLDGNGVREIAVLSNGNASDSGGDGTDEGAIYILFLDRDGTVIRNTRNPFTEEIFGPDVLDANPTVGVYSGPNSDGTGELVVTGLVGTYIASLSREGMIESARDIWRLNPHASHIWASANLNSSAPGFPDLVLGFRREVPAFLFQDEAPGDVPRRRCLWVDYEDLPLHFPIRTGNDLQRGRSMVALGDVNHDGFDDVAVGNPLLEFDDGGIRWGTILILFLRPIPGKLATNADSTRAMIAGFNAIRTITGPLREIRGFGEHMVNVGDLDHNGTDDIAVEDLGDDRTWVLFLNERGEVEWKGSIPSGYGDYDGGLAVIDDLDGDGAPELVYGNQTFEDHGAIRISYELRNVPPQITPSSEPTARFGDPVTIGARINGTVELQSAQISFRPAGYPDFFGLRMTKLDKLNFTSTVPSLFLGEGGLDYFITTDNPEGRYPSEGWISVPARHEDGLLMPSTDNTGIDYELISVPLVLDSTSARFNLEDDLGPYDISEWRLFELVGLTWAELTGRAIELEPGKGFALRRAEAAKLVRTGAGRTVPTDKPFLVRLENGWNLIGNPFAFDIPMSKLSLESGQAVELWAYHRDWEIDTDGMVPWAGYMIFSDRPGFNFDTLWVDPDVTPGNTAGGPSAEPGQERMASARTQLDALLATLSEPGEARGFGLIASVENYPNPFGDQTTIRYRLLEKAHVTLRLYDALGRLIATIDAGDRAAGVNEISWNGRSETGGELANGAYFYRLIAAGSQKSGTAVLFR